MNLQQRIDALAELGKYCQSEDASLLAAKRRAHAENGWFIPEFIDLAISQITERFLQKERLMEWAARYRITDAPAHAKNVGLIMAGNIPLVGFQDCMNIFVSGHAQTIKPSSRDEVLIRRLVEQLITIDPSIAEKIRFAERLNGADAYIATGSNNSARYFEYYFSKYPHIIRRNRTSVAVLDGSESAEQLSLLADDVYQYFGLGCRNVTKLYVPENYDFVPLLDAFGKYDYLENLAKYKHNYDYQLTLLILNKKYYMSTVSILLTENNSPFSPISVLNYQFYPAGQSPAAELSKSDEIQCVVGNGQIPFGQAQRPGLEDYADGVDTMEFLRDL